MCPLGTKSLTRSTPYIELSMVSFHSENAKSVGSYSFFGWEITKEEWVSADSPNTVLTVDLLPESDEISDEFETFLTRFDPRESGTILFVQVGDKLVPVYCEEETETKTYRGRRECTSITVPQDVLESDSDVSVASTFQGQELPEEEYSRPIYRFYRIGDSEPFAVNRVHSSSLVVPSQKTSLSSVKVFPAPDQFIAELIDQVPEFVADSV